MTGPGEAAAVEAANAELYAALEAGDLDRMEAVWDDDDPAALVCIHPGWSMLRGRGQVLRSWAAIMAGTSYIQFVLTDVAVSFPGEGVALVSCQENILTSLEELGQAPRAVTCNLFRRDAAGRWRLRAHVASPVLEPGENDEDDAAGEAGG